MRPPLSRALLTHAARRAVSAHPALRVAHNQAAGLWREARSLRVDPEKVIASRAGDAPKWLFVELTNICNANCTFCGYQYQTRDTGVMSDELYERALREYWELGGRNLSFTPLVGEALVDKNFVPKVLRARELGFESIWTYTNGILLQAHDLRALLTSGIRQLLISTSGFDKEEFHRVYRSRAYKKLLEAIRATLQLNRELGYPTKVTIELRSDSPFGEILKRPDYLKYVKPYLRDEIEDVHYEVAFDNWGGMIKSGDLTGGMVMARNRSRKDIPCDRTYSLMVMWDGRLRACSCRFTNVEAVDALEVGDLATQGMAEVWSGGRVASLRRAFPDRCLPHICSSCTMYHPAAERR